MATAKTALRNAEDIDAHSRDRKQTITFAREAVQSAEDARIITIRKIKAEDDAATLQAKNQAEQSAQQSQLQAQQAQLEAQQQAAQRAQAEEAARRAREAQQQAEANAQQAQ